ncbi:flagellar export protein FliJ [Moellerella wisconsensis]|uniref:Flagellar FliJ protein n=3 Tax=Moellerella wisconsensis TaxID=158849 RepID=A0A0N0I9M8_9GAMM|nr:flagellar export protein FliJ [Moellerella wisconsensis]KPD02322.1 FliJ family flagellar protein [Moellerella wisconsensis ATCC 35017]UNH28395.1 flagellar export protein FliJ [Moellerella wisconsensis]UNH31881.1 flagellar export protein FliJ [Moellerella wisconsensis]UNH39900.1 flagellar export protein FliJ [Moellerella wisconsensis]VFS53982.1 Flagellar fliJ protein [Moellerella wisconsensis]
MKPRSAFLNLKQISARKSEQLALQLKHQNQQVQHLQQQLQQLTDYHAEYQQQLGQQLLLGLTSATIKNYHVFLSVLEHSIAHQQQQLVISEQQRNKAQQRWRDSKQREQGFATLVQRQQMIEQAKHQQRDQKLMDEFAQRTTYRLS